MTISLQASADGLSGKIQIGGVDVANFGANIPLSHRNKIINGSFLVNQRAYVSAAAVGAGLYGHDRWKMAASGDTYTFSTTANKTTITIPSTKVLRQIIEGLNLQTGTYCLSWEGTAQGKIGAGAYGTSGVTGAITGGVATTIEFGPGTVANVQLEMGSVATPFEYRPISTELALCQRYYEVMQGQIDTAQNGASFTYTTWFYKVTKRAVATIVHGAGTTAGAAVNSNLLDAYQATISSSALRLTQGTTATSEL